MDVDTTDIYGEQSAQVWVGDCRGRSSYLQALEDDVNDAFDVDAVDKEVLIDMIAESHIFAGKS